MKPHIIHLGKGEWACGIKRARSIRGRTFTQADVRRALGETKAPTLRDVAKAGYGLELIAPHAVALACATAAGRTPRSIPRFVKA